MKQLLISLLIKIANRLGYVMLKKETRSIVQQHNDTLRILPPRETIKLLPITAACKFRVDTANLIEAEQLLQQYKELLATDLGGRLLMDNHITFKEWQSPPSPEYYGTLIHLTASIELATRS